MRTTPLLLALLVLTACNDSTGPSASTPTGMLMPLKVQNTWIGKTITLDSAGTVISTIYDTLVITGTRVVGAHDTWWTTNKTGLYFFQKNNALWKYDSLECYESYQLGLYPADLGAAFPTGCDHVFCELKGKDHPMTIAAGTFSVYDFWVETAGTGARPRLEVASYSPNIGPVFVQKTYTARTASSVGWVVWELVEYSVNP